MAVNLLAPLGERYGADALAEARRAAAACGYRLLRVDVPDERLCAWIDWRFAPSWWSSEVRAASAWYAVRGERIAGFAAFGARDLPLPWLRAYRDRDDVAIFGPYGVAPEDRGSGIGAALLTAALCGAAERAASALIPAVAGDGLIAMYRRRAAARVVDTFAYDVPRSRAVILASGNGTNAQAVLDGVARGDVALEVAAVVTNAEGAGVRRRARRAGIGDEAIVWDRSCESRRAFDARVIAAVERHAPDLVLLLGWMHLLPPSFVERFPDTLNVHPAFLPVDGRDDDVVAPDGRRIPAFRGARALEATIAQHARWSGASVHRVTADADRGAILVRTPVEIAAGATLDDVRAQIRPLERAAVAKAIRRWGFEQAVKKADSGSP